MSAVTITGHPLMRALLTALVLAGCSIAPAPNGGRAAPDIHMGETVEPPAGFSDLCRRTPDVPECAGR
jgi:predicted transglutaminase-like cysteine proteinase